MALRLLEAVVPEPDALDLAAAIGEAPVLASWRSDADEAGAVFHLLVHASDAESIMDRLQEAVGGQDGFRVVLLPVEATVPHAEEPGGNGEGEANGEPGEVAGWRVSREELYAEVTEGLDADRVFVAMALLSAVVAAIGLLRDDNAVVIGAMVIAPLLGPNVAMAFATTLGDRPLAARALRALAIGLGVALAAAVAIGVVVDVDPEVPALAARARVGYPDLALALAAGAAGTLAYSRGIAGAVIGVMVAVALMPPLVTLGLLMGAGQWAGAAQALLLLATNLICVNLAGMATFRLQGIRARTWWEEERARRATRLAFLFLGAMVALLLVAMYLARLWSLPES